MAKRELTDAYIRKLKVEARIDISDQRCEGLALRVTPTGSKTFSVRVRGRDGNAQRVSIGRYPEVSLGEARERAHKVRREIREAEGNVNEIRKAARTQERNAPSLFELINEYGAIAARNRRIWQPSKRGGQSEAYRRIMAVFGGLAERTAADIPAEDFAKAMAGYVPLSGTRNKANGQVSRARAYLMPVLDWAACRGRFRKVGAGRSIALQLADLSDTYDPSLDDLSISGERDRVLHQEELARILPLLRHPAPQSLKMQTPPELDLRPVAHRFLLLTLARLDEMVTMRWKDFDASAGVWNKPYVKTHSGSPRRQSLVLSDAAIALLKSLPGYGVAKQSDLVFPTAAGTEMQNWNRITRAIQRESNTSGWHRHDLRRTSATLLESLDVSRSVIARILGHKADTKSADTSHALKNYLRAKQILRDSVDPQKKALDSLANALAQIEADAPGSGAAAAA